MPIMATGNASSTTPTASLASMAILSSGAFHIGTHPAGLQQKPTGKQPMQISDVRNFAAPIQAQQQRNALAGGFGMPAPAPGYNALAAFGGPTKAAAAALDSSAAYEPTGDALRDGIIETARALNIDPVDLATVISYETAGTFDPAKKGPTTQWGQHRGLIQFGEPQAKQYGVDWNDPLGSQLGPDGAIAKYLKSSGFKPGMGLLDLYSTINAGGPGRYNRSDANNGGAPGTVADKVRDQMSGHRRNAEKLLGNIDLDGLATGRERVVTSPPSPESAVRDLGGQHAFAGLDDLFAFLGV